MSAREYRSVIGRIWKMWEVGGSRARAMQRKRKKEAMKTAQRGSFHFKRTQVTLSVAPPHADGTPPRLIDSQMVLTDMTRLGIILFTSEPVGPGEFVSLTIEHPLDLVVRGKVLLCQTLVFDRRIISGRHFPYRVQIEFYVNTDAELEAINRYYDCVQDACIKQPPTAA